MDIDYKNWQLHHFKAIYNTMACAANTPHTMGCSFQNTSMPYTAIVSWLGHVISPNLL